MGPPSVGVAEQPKEPLPPQPPEPSGPLPDPGKITEAQARLFQETQAVVCGNCGRRVDTPKGVVGYVVQCECGGTVEAIPF